MFDNFYDNLKGIIFDLISPARFGVRFIGRFHFLNKLLSRFFSLPEYITNRPEVIEPNSTSNLNVIEKSYSPDFILADIKEDGCSKVLELSKEFSKFVEKSFKTLRYVKDGFENEKHYSFEEIQNYEGAGKFISVNQKELTSLKEFLCAKDILNLAEDYLGSVSHISSYFTLIKYEDNESQKMESHITGWHYDLDARNFLKFFAFFDPENNSSNSGDHLVLKGSHRKRNFWDFLFRRRKVITGKRSSKITSFKFQKNKGFFEDTKCYHRAEGGSGIRGLLAFHYIN